MSLGILPGPVIKGLVLKVTLFEVDDGTLGDQIFWGRVLEGSYKKGLL